MSDATPKPPDQAVTATPPKPAAAPAAKPAAPAKAQAPRKTSGGSLPAKYWGPNGEEWSGRGRPAKWLTELEAAGHKRDEFLIPQE